MKHFQSHNINYKSWKYLEKVEKQHRLYHKYTDCSLKVLDISIVLVSENPANLGKVLTSLVNCLRINTAYFIMPYVLVLCWYCCFLPIEDLWQPCIKQVCWCHSSNSILSLWSLYHILVILIFQAFPSFSSVQFSHSVMSDSVRPHRRQPTKLPLLGILQARTLEWVAISFSNAGKWKVKVKSLTRVRL